MKNEEKKFLDKQCNPTYFQGVRTIMKSDSTAPLGLTEEYGVVVILEPLAFSVPDVSLDSRPMAGNMDRNPSECVVPKEDQNSKPTEGVTSPAPDGSVLIVNPNAEVVVLPVLTLIGKLVPVAAISVAIEDTGPPNDGPAALPEYLEEIVKGSHPSLSDAGRQLLRNLLFRYRHVFPAPGEPVTGRTMTVQHIITTDARPVRCGPRRLALADMYEGNARRGTN